MVTVIVAEPTATPVTTPAALTVATLVLLELQVTFLLEALLGDTVGVSVVVPPTAIDALIGNTVTPVTGTVVTVIEDIAVLA